MSAFSVTKLFSGMFTGDYWGKLIAFGLGFILIAFLGIGVWRGYFKKPEPTTSQKADKIDNFYYQPKSTFGCASVRVREYVEKQRIEEMTNGLRKEEER